MSETLPSRGIELSHTRDIDTSHIQQVRESVGWEPDKAEVWEQTLQTAIDVATAWEGNQLVGIGFLVGSPRHAVLCDIVVTPDRQKQGIGRDIAKSLIATAQEQNIKYVTLTFDENKPWLKDFYASLGFQSIGDAMQLAR